MKRTIELSLETAINFYKKGGEFKELALSAYTEEELTMALLPTSWEEFCKKYPVKKGEVWMGAREEIGISLDNDLDRKYRNWLPSKESAKKHLALMQLEQLRDCYRKSESSQKKGYFCINRSGNGFRIVELNPHSYQHFLSFRTFETAHAYRTNFDELLKEAGDLI